MQRIDGTELTDVSETALWTLWCRGREAARRNPIIDDPLAVRLLEHISYPYQQRFGAPNQTFALRASAFDAAVRDFLREHPHGTVVALAEGFQTSYWRLGRSQSRWVSVDLPPVVRLREQLLPQEQHIVPVASSALDLGWADHVEPGSPVLVTAEGLLCYLEKPLALGLIRACAERFPGGRFLFDALPAWWTKKKYKTFGTKDQLLGGALAKTKYVVPPMPFPASPREISKYPETIPGVASVRPVPIGAGRGLPGRQIQAFYQSKLVPSRFRGTIAELRFAAKRHNA
jgi:O-methyltransferase involved in polyketide biosynthesis